MKTVSFSLVLLLAASSAGATVLMPSDLGDLSRDAYAIARGRIAGVESRWTSADRRSVETIVTMEAAAWFKGDLGPIVRFRVPGGRLGRYRSVVVGAPSFAAGQDVIVFLGAAPPAFPYVLGLGQGVFRVTQDARGLVVTPPGVLPVVGRAVKVVRGDRLHRPLPIAEFEQHVRKLSGVTQ